VPPATTFLFPRARCPDRPFSEGTEMTTAKYLAGRAIMLLGTLAAFAFVVDGGAKRW